MDGAEAAAVRSPAGLLRTDRERRWIWTETGQGPLQPQVLLGPGCGNMHLKKNFTAPKARFLDSFFPMLTN